MSDVAQEAEASSVDTQPVPNEAENKDAPVKEVETPESEPEQTDDESSEGEGEKEPTIEERLADLEEDSKSKQKAIDRKTAAYSALNKKHEETLRELQALQSKQTEEPLKEPVIDDYETHEEYVTALREFERENAKAEAIKEFQDQTIIQQQQQIAQEREKIRATQEAEYIKDHPEYSSSKAEFEQFIKTVDTSPHVEKAFVEQAFKGNVAQLIDYFGGNGGENLGKLQEISAMSPVEAAIEVYKIQQTLKAPEKPEKKPPPPPAKKPAGGGAPRKDLSKGDVLVNLGLKEA